MISGRAVRYLLLIAALPFLVNGCILGIEDQPSLGSPVVHMTLPAHYTGTGSMSRTIDDPSGPKTCSLDGTAKTDIDVNGALTMVVIVPGMSALDWNGDCMNAEPDQQVGGIARASNVLGTVPFTFTSCNDGGMKANGSGSLYQPTPGVPALTWISADVTCDDSNGAPDFTLHASMELVP